MCVVKLVVLKEIKRQNISLRIWPQNYLKIARWADQIEEAKLNVRKNTDAIPRSGRKWTRVAVTEMMQDSRGGVHC